MAGLDKFDRAASAAPEGRPMVARGGAQRNPWNAGEFDVAPEGRQTLSPLRGSRQFVDARVPGVALRSTPGYHRSPLRGCTIAFLALGLGTPVFAADPWHLTGWSTRATVTIAKPHAAPVDCASVKVLLQGRGKADGADFRIVDSAGKALPFEVTFHDPAHYALITFQCPDPKATYFVYFGNNSASLPTERIVLDDRPGARPPKGTWIPKHGLVYETRVRPRAKDIKDETNPMTVAEMAKLIAGSPRKLGARQQPRISDGYNPFGSSDYYISLYRGWIHIPKDGTYKFCTASNEGSFSFLDGKELIHWPGRHTAERGARGEKNVTVQLTAGPHYVEYYHEEVTLEQMAFLGWRPSGDDGPFSAIPEDRFPLPHEATVVRYEDAKGPLPTFEPVITDSIWPVERGEGQYTRAKFIAPKMPASTKFAWDFGDGQSATGTDVEHVYLVAEKIYAVTLTSEGPAGKQTVTWQLDVFEIEHVTEQFKEGKPKEYARIVKAYDRNKLDGPSLKELAHLFAEAENAPAAIQACEEFVKRFPSAEPLASSRVKRLLADCQIQSGTNIEQAIANYQAALVKEMPATEKLQVLTRLIRLLGVDRGERDKALGVLKQVEEVVKESRLDDDGRKAYRQSIIAAGDALLCANKSAEAKKLYDRAEVLRGEPIASQVRAARIGSYPNSLREYITGGNLGAAIDLVNEWEDTFPTDKLNGQSFYWRGKLLAFRGQPKEAAKYLARSVEITTGAPFETEARWLLAEALDQTGKTDEARRELAKLIKTGINDEFTKRAREKLKK
jgi:tetratricopeptide (TPR) repeat protein